MLTMRMKDQVDAWMATAKFATLSTLLEGHPFGSLVAFARAGDGSMLLHLSDLAVHSQCLRTDARCSLMVSDPATASPQTSWRLTFVGTASIDDAQWPQFSQRHPEATQLGGFHVWRVKVQKIRYIAGFGSMGWL
jgi:heme iron utilization protein